MCVWDRERVCVCTCVCVCSRGRWYWLELGLLALSILDVCVCAYVHACVCVCVLLGSEDGGYKKCTFQTLIIHFKWKTFSSPFHDFVFTELTCCWAVKLQVLMCVWTPCSENNVICQFYALIWNKDNVRSILLHYFQRGKRKSPSIHSSPERWRTRTTCLYPSLQCLRWKLSGPTQSVCYTQQHHPTFISTVMVCYIQQHHPLFPVHTVMVCYIQQHRPSFISIQSKCAHSTYSKNVYWSTTVTMHSLSKMQVSRKKKKGWLCILKTSTWPKTNSENLNSAHHPNKLSKPLILKGETDDKSVHPKSETNTWQKCSSQEWNKHMTKVFIPRVKQTHDRSVHPKSETNTWQKCSSQMNWFAHLWSRSNDWTMQLIW